MTNLLLFPLDEDDASPNAKTTKQREKRKIRKASSRATRTQPTLELPGFEVSSVELGASQATEHELPSIENQLIRASAGTGKTYQLTSRYLRLLLLGAAPESILATTFTRKAAGEILDRVVVWLARAATDAKELRNLSQATGLPSLSHDQCRENLAVLTTQMHRLRIYTLDAFFMQMAMSFSLELGMTPGWQILEEGGPESNALRNDAIAGVLRQESLEDLLVLVYQLSRKGEVKRGLDAMLKASVMDAYRLFLDSTNDAWDKLDVPPPLSHDELAEVTKELHVLPVKGKQIPRAVNADVTRILNENWRGFFESGPTLVKNINEGKPKYQSANIPAELLRLYQRFLPHLRSMILQSASAQTRATHQFLGKYHGQYREQKESQRLYGFDEVTDLLAATAEQSDMAQFSFRMDAGVDHLLLDEFQDTSIPQWRALSKLAHRCSSNEPGRSFFCVGDVKQAIYGWRGGSSEIFDVLDRRLPNVVNSELKESRRSSPIIMDAVNAVFQFLPNWDPTKLGRSKRAASNWSFPSHSTHRKDLPGHFTIETADAAGPSREEQEGEVFRRAAHRVAAMTSQAKSRSIGVLCRRNDKVGQMMNELQRLGVPASEEGGNLLTDSAAVELVLSLLQLTDHPSDSIVAFHLASSPWARELGLRVGACDTYPRHVSAASDANNGSSHATERLAAESLADPSADSDPSSASARDGWRPPGGIDPKAINTLVRRVRRHVLDDGFGNTVQAWSEQLRHYCNRREARRLTQLVEMAYEYQHRVETPTQMGYARQRRQSIRPTEFVRCVRETKVADPSNATVRVMTVHQAKGLEFDIVVLPDLLGPFVDGHDTFLYRRTSIETDIDLVCRYMGKDSGRSFLPDEFMPLFDDFEDRKARESFCILYVAMTRAVHALHVFLPAGMQRLRMAKGHPAYLIKDTFVPGVGLEPATTLYEAGDRHWFINDPGGRAERQDETRQRFPKPRLAKSKPQARHLDTVAPSQIGSGRHVQLGSRFTKKSDEGRIYGSLVHLWLSQIEWLDDGRAVPTDTQLREIAELFADKVEIGASLERFKAMLTREPLGEILNRAEYEVYLRAALPNWKDTYHIEVRAEQPVAGRHDAHILSGTIDRLVLIRDERAIVAAEIIDYKTGLDDLPEAEAIARKTERYEKQMAAYRRAIASSLRITNVLSRLVFL